VNVQRVVAVYSRVLAWGGLILLLAVVLVDRRWTTQLPIVLVMVAVCIPLRANAIPLSKYSYLTQTGLVAVAGSLLVGVPAAALGVAGGVLGADWVWQRKPLIVARVNLGREVITLIAASGIYAGTLRLSGISTPGIRVETIPAVFFFVLAYFLFGRLLFYFTLLLRSKLEYDEQLLIIRYECIAYFSTIIAASTVVGTVLAWPHIAWLFVGSALWALGMLFKRMLEEAISAEELNKIHAIEAVITSNVSLKDSFARIERLARRLVDWGDFRIYRRGEEGLVLAYRSATGRPERGEPTADTARLRQEVLTTGELVIVDDASRDERVADLPEVVQSLLVMPLKFGDQVTGTLELEHHKRRTYRRKDLVTIATFANQLATAIHITDLRRPLVETVERMTRELTTLTGAATALRQAAGSVAHSTEAIRSGVASEQGEVAGGLEATNALSRVSQRVLEDGAGAAQASSSASEVATRNRQRIQGALERLVTLKTFVGESSAKVQQLGTMSRRITGFIASIREFSDMTNLLALNAAIEAARAGKHGKGFAVVADEVRRLAEQSAEAAAEAGELVLDIHRQVGEVVEQMRRGQVTVGGVEDLSAGALQALEAIVAATADATGHAQRIAATAEEQDVAFAKLRERIHSVAAIAQQNRAEADDVATRAGEAAAGLTNLEQATRELERVATDLRELTRGFASLR